MPKNTPRSLVTNAVFFTQEFNRIIPAFIKSHLDSSGKSSWANVGTRKAPAELL